MNVEQFNQTLAHEGLLVAGGAPPLPAKRIPWHVVALAGFGAWLAAIFVLMALGVGALPLLESRIVRGAAGLVACVVCAGFARRRDAVDRATEHRQVFGIAETASSASSGGVFGAQFQTAMSLTGFGLIVSAILLRSEWSMPHSSSLVYAEIMAVAIVLWWFNPQAAHRQLMAWAALAALVVLLGVVGGLPLAPPILAAGAALIWLTQSRWSAFGARHAIDALGTAAAGLLILLPVGFNGFGVVEALGVSALERHGVGASLAGLLAVVPWLPVSLIGLSLIAASLAIAARHQAGVAFKAGLCVAIVCVTVASWRAPGIVACLLVWALATATGRGLLRAGALLGLCFHLFHLYYDLQSSLLAKGGVLLASGAVVLLIRVSLQWAKPR